MEALSGSWEKFYFSELEGRRLIVEESEDEHEFFLSARFYIGRVLNMEAIAKTLRLLW